MYVTLVEVTLYFTGISEQLVHQRQSQKEISKEQ